MVRLSSGRLFEAHFKDYDQVTYDRRCGSKLGRLKKAVAAGIETYAL